MSSNDDQSNAALAAAFADALGTTDYEIVGESVGRLPSGEEIRLVHAAVRGEPNRTASLAVDASGAVHPPRRLEAIGGRDLFHPQLPPSTAEARPPTPSVAIDPPVNEWVLPECSTAQETITVTIPASSVTPKADIYLLADTTGSMGAVIGAVQAGIGAILSDPALQGLDLAWGVGNYKDFPLGAFNAYAFQPQLSPTSVLADVATAVSSWTAFGGSDVAEGQLFALQTVATDPGIGWRTDSKRIVVWFGDAPGHDPVCAALTGSTDVDEGTATAALVAAGITVLAVSTNTGAAGALDDDPVPFSTDYGACGAPGGTPGQATRIASATGGSHTVGVDPASVVATLLSVITAAVTTIGSVSLQPTGDAGAFVTSINPSSYGPLPGHVEQVLTFQVDWRGVRECEDSDVVLGGSIDVVVDGAVVASKPVTVTVPACPWHHSVEVSCGQAKGDERGCRPLADGYYATIVTAYNPHPCPVRVEKRFAPLIVEGKPIGREPETQEARPFERIELRPGHATFDDCCALEQAVGPLGGGLLFGVLDLVADRPLEVTVTHTAAADAGAPVVTLDARTIEPRRS